MIGQALKDKLRARGVLGFAGDAVETLAVVTFWGAVFGAAVAATVVIVPPVLLLDKLWGLAAGPHFRRCGAECASGAVPCDHRGGRRG